MPILKQIQVNKAIAAAVYSATCNFKDLTLGTDVADAVLVDQPGTIFCLAFVVHRVMAADAVIQIYVDNVLLSFTPGFLVSHTVPLLTPQLVTTGFTSAAALSVNQVFTWGVFESDGSIDPAGVISLAVRWQ